MANEKHAAEPQAALKNSRLAVIISIIAGIGAVAAFALPDRATKADVQKVADEARRLGAEQAEVARVALALASVQLQTSVVEGAAYETEAALVQRLGAGKDLSAELAILSVTARRGIPTTADLLAAFDTLAVETMAGEASSWTPTWMAGAIHTVKSTALGLVMETNLTPPGSPAGPVIRAMRTALASGDVQEALTVSDALPDAAKPAFDSWRKTALARIDAIAAANRIVQRSAITTAKKS